MKLFGKTTEEKFAKESNIANEIVKKIFDFGANDHIRLKVIKGLLLQMEDMTKIQKLIVETNDILSMYDFYSKTIKNRFEELDGQTADEDSDAAKL